MEEARLTLDSAKVILEVANERDDMWAQVVKNAYDAIEQAISAAIAASGESVPRNRPAKVNRYLGLHDTDDSLGETILYWLRRRSDSQYVDIRGEDVAVPHELFDADDAEEIVAVAETVLSRVDAILEET